MKLDEGEADLEKSMAQEQKSLDARVIGGG